MKLWNHIVGLSALVAIYSAGLVSAQEQTAGVVRISDLATAGQTTQTALETEAMEAVAADCRDCKYGPLTHKCPRCQGGTGPFLCRECYMAQNGGLKELGGMFCRRRAIRSHFDPATGQMNYCDRPGFLGMNCRRTVPMSNAPFGMYRMAYPLDPHYLDARDGGLYAAQGYGVNISVPLAPTVSAAYNYGWGVPSSRMTYISNPIPLPETYLPAVPGQP